MEYSRSAGVFLSGAILSIIGPLATWAAFLAAALRPQEGALFFSIGCAAVGLTLLGFIQLIVSVFRAFRKIDSLYTPQRQRV
ncbi:hypothetical protein CVCC1112_2615 [Paenarthrobacter nicotinovorans]|uniref:hypothetical protein n=1 Tax=Paenarthrobacter nicotinovorans TaxID=29320 RepID=UPI0007CC4ECD|nr:hypothetical protein [Paenarthrobacter nicotinovorans]GAT87956.1 hypothetical protein CVCC1112_2615 [Paenarthrobacter nicotinovorans]